MKTKKDIVGNWLPRYTGTPVSDFGKYLLLVTFQYYVHLFAEWVDVPIQGTNRQMPNATSGNISIINLGMGSANAATVMELLNADQREEVLFHGKCGGMYNHRNTRLQYS